MAALADSEALQMQLQKLCQLKSAALFWETIGGGRIIKIVLAPPLPHYNQNYQVSSLIFTDVY